MPGSQTHLLTFALALSAACGRVDFALLSDADGADAPLGEFQGAAPIGVTATAADEDDPEISADGLELFFSLSLVTDEEDLWTSTRTALDQPWSAPVAVTELNTSPYFDKAPALSEDMLTMWFVSDRASGAVRIYKTTRAARGSPWSAPTAVTELSRSLTTGSPCVRGDRIVFREGAGDGTHNLLYAHLAGSTWGTPRLIDELNTASEESGGFLAGDLLYFDSNRAGTDDVYVSRYLPETDSFGPPALVTALSTAAGETDPSLTADGRTVVFRRRLVGGTNDIWIATR